MWWNGENWTWPYEAVGVSRCSPYLRLKRLDELKRWAGAKVSHENAKEELRPGGVLGWR